LDPHRGATARCESPPHPPPRNQPRLAGTAGMQTRHGRYKRIPALAVNGQSEPNGAPTARQRSYLPRHRNSIRSGAQTPHLPAEMPTRPVHGRGPRAAQIHRTGHGFADQTGTLTAWAIRMMKASARRRTVGRSDRRDIGRRRSRQAKGARQTPSAPQARSSPQALSSPGGMPGRPPSRLNTPSRLATRRRLGTPSRLNTPSRLGTPSRLDTPSQPQVVSRPWAPSHREAPSHRLAPRHLEAVSLHEAVSRPWAPSHLEAVSRP
jgi:hypothetical protein